MPTTTSEVESDDLSEELTPEEFCAELGALYNQAYPKITGADLQLQEALQTKVSLRERTVNDRELLEVLAAYGIDQNLIEIDQNGRYHVKVNEHFTQDRLPEGYGYAGGAARVLLLKNLGISPKFSPRDLDIVRFLPEEPEMGLDDKLARKYSPDDYRHGYGVNPITDLGEYFSTRDFTMNEILATDDEIITTRGGLLDNIRHIIRLTEYSKDTSPDSKLLAKCLRFYAGAIHRWDEAALEDIDEYYLEWGFITPFWLALNLDKAYQEGSHVAEAFIEELKRRQQLPEEIKTVEEAAEYLLGLIRDRDFYYRHAPTRQFEVEDHWLEDYKEYEKYPSSLGMGRHPKEK